MSSRRCATPQISTLRLLVPSCSGRTLCVATPEDDFSQLKRNAVQVRGNIETQHRNKEPPDSPAV